MPRLSYRTELPFPPEEVFAWHERPGALERLVPPWLRVEVEERDGGLEEGTQVRLGVRQGPGRFSWTLQHAACERGRQFRDEQVEGPFRRWVHTHRFEDDGRGGCVMEDVVEWEPPLGEMARALVAPWVGRELDRLFAFRHRRLENDLTLHARYRGSPLTVVVTGSSGLIGNALCLFLEAGGHAVRRLRRYSAGGPAGTTWDPERGVLSPSALEGADAVVHLAGESLAALRWTREKKRKILESRRKGTALLASTLARMSSPPPVLVSASAVGYYGDRGNDRIGERAGPGKGFLAQVCREWEGATSVARKAGLRVVNLRTGFVISPLGPGLGRMIPAFRAGVGGRIGSGRQYMSWIDLDDEIGLILHALTNRRVEGPLNGTAPNPVPNAAFADTLGRVLGRPTIVPLPSLAVRAALGELGTELLLKGVRALPQKALETGYRFLFTDLEDSLRFQLGREDYTSKSPEGERAG